jgi:hypothetical protein
MNGELRLPKDKPSHAAVPRLHEKYVQIMWRTDVKARTEEKAHFHLQSCTLDACAAVVALAKSEYAAIAGLRAIDLQQLELAFVLSGTTIAVFLSIDVDAIGVVAQMRMWTSIDCLAHSRVLG